MTTTSDQIMGVFDRGNEFDRGGELDRASEFRRGNGAVPDTGEMADATKPRLPSLDLETPAQPVFSEDGWLEEQAGTLADHPLLRGLLMELPPKGATLPPGWLDRWFEATRAILELIYLSDHR